MSAPLAIEQKARRSMQRRASPLRERPYELILGTVLVLGLLIPLLLAPRAPAELTDPALIPLSLAAFSSFRLALIVATRRIALVEAGFWVFMYVWGGLAPLVQLSENLFPFPGLYAHGDRTTAALMAWVAALCFLVGLGAAKSPRIRSPRESVRKIDVRRVTWVASLGLILLIVLVPVAGGVSAFFRSRSELAGQLHESTAGNLAQFGLVSAAMSVPVFVALYCILALRRQRGELAPAHSVLIPILVLATVVVSNPVSSPRYWFGTVVLSIGAVLLPVTRRSLMRAWVLMLLVGTLVVFPIADAFRYEGSTDLSLTVGPSRFVAADYDAFQQSLNGLAFVADEGHQSGRQVIGAVLFFVPREVWPAKPVGTGEMLATYAGYTYTNISSPLWVEAFIDFGWLGVIGALALYGWCAGRLDLAYARSRHGYLAAIAPILAAYQFWLLRGSLLASVSRLTVLLLVVYVCTSRSRSPSERAGGRNRERRAPAPGRSNRAHPALPSQRGLARKSAAATSTATD